MNTITGERNTSVYKTNHTLNVSRHIVKQKFQEILERSDDLGEEDPFTLNEFVELLDDDSMPSSSPMESTDYGGHAAAYTLEELRRATVDFRRDFKVHLTLLVTALKEPAAASEDHIKKSVKHVNSIYEVDGVYW